MKNINDIKNNINENQKKYDLSLIPDNFNYGDKLQIICHEKDELGREHGVFETTYSHFVKRGDGCPKCRGKYMDKDLFVFKSRQIHGDLYNYDDFEFENKHSKSTIYCNKHNIKFVQTAVKHLNGQGCPICRYEKTSQSEMLSKEDYIKKANEIHNWKYDYTKTVYSGYKNKILVTCHELNEDGTEHGDFYILANNHVNASHPQGCPICGRLKNTKNRTYTYEKFEELANERHDHKYKYLHDYVNTTTKVKIICPKHGVFEMTPANHLQGQGCPTCGLVFTNPEKEIIELIKSILGQETEVLIHSRQIINPFELDIFIPSINLAIEYNGLIWHSEKFSEDYKIKHLRKLNICNEKGIRLIQIFEDEWIYKKEIVVSRIKSILGKYDNVIYARKCEIKNVDYDVAAKFLNENHLQGFCHSKIQYGLYYNNELISVMTFGHTRQMKKYNEYYNKTFELLRFAVKQNTIVIGGASKLLNHFIKNNDFNEIVSYADKRWSQGNLYFNLGFEHTHDSKPNYFYVDGKIRKNRFNYRKSNLVKKGYDKTKSEHEIMKELGFYRIYDCGTMVFKLNNKVQD